jgi:hypothetical protein
VEFTSMSCGGNRRETRTGETAIMPRYRLRVERPDRPDAPAKLAEAVRATGGDVVSIDMEEVDGPSTVNEVVVDVPSGVDPVAVAARFEDADAGTVLSSQVTSVRLVEPEMRAFEWARCLIDARPADRNDTLLRVMSEACRCSRAWVVPVGEALAVPAGRLAVERGRALARRSDAPDSGPDPVSSPAAPGWQPSVWVLAVPDRHPDPACVAFMTRPLSLRFTSAEVARAEAIMATHALVKASYARATASALPA